MRLDWKKTFILGLGFFSIMLVWSLYNNYVPIYLQAGNPQFDASQSAITPGFGLGPALTGIIMTLDNLAAFFIQPLVGLWSDRTYTRIGRRMPFILAATPFAMIAFILIPVAPLLIPPELNGNLPELTGPFALFVGAAGVMLLAMAVLRTPVMALMPDLIASPLRSKANGAINLMGGLGGAIAFIAGGFLYRIYGPLPFWAGAAVTIAAVTVLFLVIKEPKELVESARDGEENVRIRDIVAGLTKLPRENARSLILLMLAIFFWFIGYNVIETFFSSYAIQVLEVDEGLAARLLSVAFISFLLFAIPSGYIASRFGRRRTILAGLVLFGGLLLAAFFVPKLYFIVAALALGGIGWSLININSLPMVVDISPSQSVLGTYTGLYFLAQMLSAVVGPIFNGFVIEQAGSDYNLIFLLTPGFFLLAILCMLPITKGEAKEESTP